MMIKLALLLSAASTVLAHSNMFFPVPRGDFSYAYQDPLQNACENEDTNIPGENTFARGQEIVPKWWWNNHRGAFIKFALTKTINGRVSNNGFNDNSNIIQGQCYTGGCDQNGFDPGNTHPCIGKPLTFPDWVSDGEYVLQWTQIGGFDSDAIATKQLPLYKTCANIRIQGGVPLQARPNDWIAPFFGGSQDVIRGQSGGDDVCGFKQFNREPEDPRQVNVDADVFVDNMQFGGPGGWAAVGATNQKRANTVILPRLGHIARRLQAGHLN
jgi:hypothetical protein